MGVGKRQGFRTAPAGHLFTGARGRLPSFLLEASHPGRSQGGRPGAARVGVGSEDGPSQRFGAFGSFRSRTDVRQEGIFENIFAIDIPFSGPSNGLPRVQGRRTGHLRDEEAAFGPVPGQL